MLVMPQVPLCCTLLCGFGCSSQIQSSMKYENFTWLLFSCSESAGYENKQLPVWHITLRSISFFSVSAAPKLFMKNTQGHNFENRTVMNSNF